MKKAQNRLSDLKTDFTLPRKKILRGKRNFQNLFQSSSILHSTSFVFRYRLYPESTEGIKVGFVAPKRKFRKAVERNKVKRVIREAYRIQQYKLFDVVSNHGGSLHGIFIAKKNSPYIDVKNELAQVIEQLEIKIGNKVEKVTASRHSQSPIKAE